MLAWTTVFLVVCLLPSQTLPGAAGTFRNAYHDASNIGSGIGGVDSRQTDNIIVLVDQNAAKNIPSPFSSNQGIPNFGNFAGSGRIIGVGGRSATFGNIAAAAGAGGPGLTLDNVGQVFGQDGPGLVRPGVILGSTGGDNFDQGFSSIQGNFVEGFGQGGVSGAAIAVGGGDARFQGVRASGITLGGFGQVAPAPVLGGPAPVLGGPAAFLGGPSPFLGGPAPVLGGPAAFLGGPAPVVGGPISGGLPNIQGGAAFGGFGQGAVGQVNRVLEAPLTPTVTKTVTIDRFVTLTDTAFHSVPVTLTDLIVRTVLSTTRQVLQTPRDDRMSLQTTVLVRPTSVTVTCTKTDYRLATETLVDHVTITHTSYRIQQVTYTTTVTQALTHTSTFVRTVVRTQTTKVTDYRSITEVAYARNRYY